MMLATMWTPLATFICKIYLVTSELLCLSCCYVCAVSVSWAGYLLESHIEKCSAKEWAMNSLICVMLDVWLLLIFYFPIIANVLMRACKIYLVICFQMSLYYCTHFVCDNTVVTYIRGEWGLGSRENTRILQSISFPDQLITVMNHDSINNRQSHTHIYKNEDRSPINEYTQSPQILMYPHGSASSFIFHNCAQS